MRGCVLLAVLALVAIWTVPDIGHASGATKAAEEEDTTEVITTGPPLPASMRHHGVIGHVPLPDGMDILDADILARMRDRLIVFSQHVEE
ncbi:hypothetical protein [Sulfitobacter sp. CW3]|uniref:hypothetical protein n=1 Tax=Sulfitobacter sp. CW3 TaxID=2861965 RepID=UPI001C5D2009|nr:hypothetical protein [Sulfitobacter sp. CW3]MBW4961670.1 hypothetical protein [Sulfitobacter sp. CW3]